MPATDKGKLKETKVMQADVEPCGLACVWGLRLQVYEALSYKCMRPLVTWRLAA